MMLSEHVLTYGYWPSRQLSGQNPAPIRHPDEYTGSNVVNVACTQTGLSPREQRNLVEAWCSLLPELPVKTLLFSSKVNQKLFEAAVANPKLEALSLKWSSVESIGAVADHPSLTALYVGDSPSLAGLDHLSSLPNLRHLFIQGVRESADLAFAGKLLSLVEFGISGGSKPLRVASLEPLQALQSLAILWLVRVRPVSGGLEPLHQLAGLRSFRTSLNLQSSEVAGLRNAVPALQYLQPVW
jgi:hypothetical protein